MTLKNLKFINPLSESEEKELQEYTEKCYEQILKEQFVKAMADRIHWLYLLISTSLLFLFSTARPMSDSLQFWYFTLKLIYIGFYLFTNMNFRRIYAKLIFDKKLPLLDKETLEQCLEYLQKLRCNETVKELLATSDTEIRCTLTEDGICFSRPVEESEAAALTKTDFLNVKKIKYDESITEFIYDISDLSLTLYSEQDPMPKHLCDIETKPEEQGEING